MKVKFCCSAALPLVGVFVTAGGDTLPKYEDDYSREGGESPESEGVIIQTSFFKKSRGRDSVNRSFGERKFRDITISLATETKCGFRSLQYLLYSECKIINIVKNSKKN